MTTRLVLLAAAALLLGAAAPPPPAGALGCAGCHGARFDADGFPVLRNRSAAAIIQAMTEYRAGVRTPGNVMERIVRGFTPAEIEAIAAWMEELPP